MAKANPVRLSICLAVGALFGGCGPSAPAPVGNESAEVTIVLPPALPAERSQGAPPPPPQAAENVVEIPLPAPVGADAAVPSPTVEAGLVSAPPPIAMGSLGRYIRGAGFACDEVVASRQLEREGGARVGIYRFDCGSGQSYQGTMRQNHLYFREWRGIPAG